MGISFASYRRVAWPSLLALLLPAAAAATPDAWPAGPRGDGSLRVVLRVPFRAPVSQRIADDGSLRILIDAPSGAVRRRMAAPTAFDRAALLTIEPAGTERTRVSLSLVAAAARCEAIVLDDRLWIDVFPAPLAMQEIVARQAPDPVPPPVPALEIVAEPEPPARPDSLLFEEGLRLHRTLSYDGANLWFSRLLEHHRASPHAIPSMLQIASIFRSLRDYSKEALAVERALTRAALTTSDSLPRADLMVRAARAQADAGRHTEAYRRAETLIRHHGAHGCEHQAHLAMARAAAALRHHTDARAAVAAGLAQCPDPARALRLRRLGAEIERQARRPDAALAQLDSALTLPAAPRAELFLERADTGFQARRMAQAHDDYLKALEQNLSGADRDWARYQVANTLLRSGRLREAEAAYAACASDQPAEPWRERALWRLALARWMRERSVEIERLTGSPPQLVASEGP